MQRYYEKSINKAYILLNSISEAGIAILSLIGILYKY